MCVNLSRFDKNNKIQRMYAKMSDFSAMFG